MKLLYILFTHNRPHILQKCVETLFSNNSVTPDRVIIIDDGSDPDLKNSLFNFSISSSIRNSVDFFSITKNLGYGQVAELALRLVSAYNPEYAFFIESDYVFSKNGLDTVMDIFENNEYGKNCIGFSGYDNPDFYVKDKTDKTFREIILNDCGEDNLNREIMYKPFDLETKFGTKQVEFVSNSCGTMYFNWSKIETIKKQFPVEFEFWINKTTDKHKQKRNLNDGMMSHGISWLWTKWAAANNVDTNKYAALLNIKPSVADHINGGGINGYVVQEGQTFVSSPSFK